MDAKTYATRAEADAEIAAADAALGYPRTETGTRVGGGRHVDEITTTSAAVAVRLRDGSYAVSSVALARGGRSVAGARDVSADYPAPPQIGPARVEGAVDAGRVR